ncbi:MAG: hypothetical protein AAF738_05995 [Bacteroidota bacterium]
MVRLCFFTLLSGLLLISFAACQNNNTSQGDNSSEIIASEEPTAAEKAAAKTKALLAKYPSQEGHIQLHWDTLANMGFDIQYVEELEGEVPFPVFSETVKELEGELIIIEGYVIPFEETGDETVVFLSAFPYTQCFFCGAAGPESVIDILTDEKLNDLEMDEKTTFRGRLRLNGDDLDYLNYIMDDAELVE